MEVIFFSKMFEIILNVCLLQTSVLFMIGVNGQTLLNATLTQQSMKDVLLILKKFFFYHTRIIVKNFMRAQTE